MGEWRGYRLALAIPNDSGPHGVPSFRGKFLVAESSDFSEMPSKVEIIQWVVDNAGGEMVTVIS